MGGIRVLVGTIKGAFILTADGARARWDVKGPLFGGWEMYHLTGSPADPRRLWASQGTGWFGQLIQRSDDGGETWEPVGNEFAYATPPVQIGLGTREAAVQARSEDAPTSRASLVDPAAAGMTGLDASDAGQDPPRQVAGRHTRSEGGLGSAVGSQHRDRDTRLTHLHEGDRSRHCCGGRLLGRIDFCGKDVDPA